ncbi:MAG: hypothetical protein K2O41_05665 [Clostridia bacterium]|nr:hypothetical protein [Clostridia bacterium]
MKNPPLHSIEEYKEYMKAYDEFYHKRKAFSKRGSPKLDSQFSENIAADYFDFNLDHKNGFDGHNSKGKSCEVKGTGYKNTRVGFTQNQISADHIYWVKADEVNRMVNIQEIDLSKCVKKFNNNGCCFITLGSKNSQIKIKKTYNLKY